MAIDAQSIIFSTELRRKRVFLFNLNLPYILMTKSVRILSIKMMEDINKN